MIMTKFIKRLHSIYSSCNCSKSDLHTKDTLNSSLKQKKYIQKKKKEEMITTAILYCDLNEGDTTL